VGAEPARARKRARRARMLARSRIRVDLRIDVLLRWTGGASGRRCARRRLASGKMDD
jgi:hypothetical protein